MKYFLPFIIMIIVITGCAGTHIPREEYSALETPQEMFEFAQKTVAMNDPEAFYYCLSQHLTKQIDLDKVKLGWSLAGNLFSLLLEAKIKSVERPAPEYARNLDTAKVTIVSGDLEVAFLFLNEGGQWKIWPFEYPLPDINKLAKKKNIPWRSETAYYTNSPSDWYKTAKEHNISRPLPTRCPAWRTIQP